MNTIKNFTEGRITMTNAIKTKATTKDYDRLDDILAMEKELAEECPELAELYTKFQQEKATLMPELTAYYNGDTETAARVAEDLAHCFVYGD